MTLVMSNAINITTLGIITTVGTISTMELSKVKPVHVKLVGCEDEDTGDTTENSIGDNRSM